MDIFTIIILPLFFLVPLVFFIYYANHMMIQSLILGAIVLIGLVVFVLPMMNTMLQSVATNDSGNISQLVGQTIDMDYDLVWKLIVLAGALGTICFVLWICFVSDWFEESSDEDKRRKERRKQEKQMKKNNMIRVTMTKVSPDRDEEKVIEIKKDTEHKHSGDTIVSGWRKKK